jgi:hypothetical protein
MELPALRARRPGRLRSRTAHNVVAAKPPDIRLLRLAGPKRSYAYNG